MCGICGAINLGSRVRTDDRLLKSMISAIQHRGPDAFGVYWDEQAGLGHARLSIVDVAGGDQPMTNEDGQLWVVFNGEIYNHVELRERLVKQGHRFTTRSDTEVILHLYEEEGPRCVERMNGQFAFAIWDARARRAFLARDRFGVRPLFYTVANGRLLFASEIKSLFASSDVKPAFDPIGLEQAFTFWSPLAPYTAFAGIRQLPAAHTLITSGESLHITRYWDMPYGPEHAEEDARPEAYYIERLREELHRATRIRLASEVPMGAFLSGGLDSSLTCSLVKEATSVSPRTYSVAFADAHFDERQHQDTMANALHSDHHSLTITSADIARSFRDVVWHTETPLLRTAPAPLHLLARLVREDGVKVILTGEGADELLAGYDIFKEMKVRRFWARNPNAKWGPLLLNGLYPDVPRETAPAFWQHFFSQGLRNTDDPCYSHRTRWANIQALKALFAPEWRRRIGTYDSVAAFEEGLPDHFNQWAPLSKAQYIEMATFMTPYLLSSQGDRMAMSHSVEGRFPFLDHELAAFAATIPSRYRLRGLEEKHVLRQAARGLVPDAIANRRKRPYRAPDSRAFQCPEGLDVIRQTLSRTSIEDAGCFNYEAVGKLIDRCQRPSATGPGMRADMGFLAVLSTQLLYEQFIHSPRRHQPIPDSRFRVYGPGVHKVPANAVLKGEQTVYGGARP